MEKTVDNCREDISVITKKLDEFIEPSEMRAQIEEITNKTKDHSEYCSKLMTCCEKNNFDDCYNDLSNSVNENIIQLRRIVEVFIIYI